MARAHLILAATLCLVFPLSAARAETVRVKTLRRLEVSLLDEAEGGYQAVVRFERPLRYLRHSPNDRGRIVRIELAEQGGGGQIDDGLRVRETLPPPPDPSSPLLEVIYERDREGELSLVLRFESEIDFTIEPSGDARSLRVVMKAAAREGGRAKQIMDEASRAMTAREYARAAALYELVLGDEAGANADASLRRDALEYLGLAHERSGQLAHARAEYERYLEAYPEGEASDRVRQRLDALITALDAPRERLRVARVVRDEPSIEFFGDASVGYYRNENLVGDRENPVYNSTVLAGLFATARGEVSEWDLVGDLAISHDEEFERDGDASRTRVNTMSLETRTPDRRWTGIVGRQSKRDGGVLGRFDGGVLRARVHDRVEIGGVFGFPLETTTSSSIETDKLFVGGTTDFELPFDGTSAQLFTIGQLNQDFVDRVALGSEINYVHRRGYARAFLDYDVYYQLLNLAIVSGSLEIDDKTRMNVFLQTQTVPFFTLENALQGQFARDLDELDESFSKKEIRDLAKDRTARSYTATLGGSRWLNSELQLAADISFIAVGSTDASFEEGDEGFVAATDGTSGDISASMQLTQNDLFGLDDISSVSVRYSNGQITDTYRLLLRSRLPLTRNVHLDPRISLDYRDHREGGTDQILFIPNTRLVWDWKQFSVELQAGLESREFFGDNAPDHELGYVADVLIRGEF